MNSSREHIILQFFPMLSHVSNMNSHLSSLAIGDLTEVSNSKNEDSISNNKQYHYCIVRVLCYFFSNTS